jgi:hypothetical protein
MGRNAFGQLLPAFANGNDGFALKRRRMRSYVPVANALRCWDQMRVSREIIVGATIEEDRAIGRADKTVKLGVYDLIWASHLGILLYIEDAMLGLTPHGVSQTPDLLDNAG